MVRRCSLVSLYEITIMISSFECFCHCKPFLRSVIGVCFAVKVFGQLVLLLGLSCFCPFLTDLVCLQAPLTPVYCRTQRMERKAGVTAWERSQLPARSRVLCARRIQTLRASNPHKLMAESIRRIHALISIPRSFSGHNGWKEKHE